MTKPTKMAQRSRSARQTILGLLGVGAAAAILIVSESGETSVSLSRITSSLYPPLPPPPCSSARGGAGGHWERDVHLADLTHYDPTYPAYKKSNPYHVPDPSDPQGTKYRKPTTYAWRDPPAVESQCGRVGPLTAASFCVEAGRLGIDRVMFVGDSIGFQQYYSFVKQIGLEVSHKNAEGKNSAQSSETTFTCPGTSGGRVVALTHVRNDKLITGDQIPEKVMRGDVLNDWTAAYTAVPPSVRTLLVVNTGAHFIRDPYPPFLGVVDRFFDRVGSEFHRTNDLVFFRTTPAGHPTCADATEPFTRQDEYYDSLEHPPTGKENRVRKYGWGTFGELNDVVKEALGRYNEGGGGGGVNGNDGNITAASSGPESVYMLDVVPMTNLRPDGHQSSPDNLNPGKPEWDCLHYSMPGPIDWFNNLLWANLGDLSSIDEGGGAAAGALRTPQVAA